MFLTTGRTTPTNGMMGLIASLCQNRGLDPNLVTALMSNRNGNNGVCY